MATDNTGFESDGLGDWRLQAVSRIAADIPSAYPGGPSHKAGAVATQTTMASAPQHPNLGFATPSATALALSASFRSAERAALHWSRIEFRTTVTPDGPGSAVTNVVTLFDYFEEALAAANSSFQAIEAFANATIARLLNGKLTFQQRNGSQQMSAEEIERRLSTSEKIATILPALTDVSSIKGSYEWQLFNKLKNVRDASTHFKSGDQYPGNGKVEKGSLFDILLNAHPSEYPLTAVRVISRFSGTPRPRWLATLIQIHQIT